MIAPALEPGTQLAFFVCGGEVRSCSLPLTTFEIETMLALCRAAREDAADTLNPEQAEDLLLIDGFVRRPSPELTVLPLDAQLIGDGLTTN